MDFSSRVGRDAASDERAAPLAGSMEQAVEGGSYWPEKRD
jgi:hypothetical protein